MFTKELTYEGILEEERIARIGSNDPESHMGIPYSHVSANIYDQIEKKIRCGGWGRVEGGWVHS
jgi:hypothetical protein